MNLIQKHKNKQVNNKMTKPYNKVTKYRTIITYKTNLKLKANLLKKADITKNKIKLKLKHITLLLNVRKIFGVNGTEHIK